MPGPIIYIDQNYGAICFCGRIVFGYSPERYDALERSDISCIKQFSCDHEKLTELEKDIAEKWKRKQFLQYKNKTEVINGC